MTDAPVLAVDGLTKRYPGVVANDAVSFSIGSGEIHALLGENGAGKSTLVKMVYGLVSPDFGKMAFAGLPYAPHNPQNARQAGVAMVFQHFSLFDALDVTANIALGLAAPRAKHRLAERIREVSDTYGLPLDPTRRVGDLSAGERQRVEIIRCLLQEPKLLIMDEPTSVLTPQEVEALFGTLRKLQAEGMSTLYISHKLEEIRSLCDRATVLRQGQVVASCVPKEVSAKAMAEMMVGSKIVEPIARAHAKGAVALSVRGLTTQPADPFATALRNIEFDLCEGEILGIGGVAGNGQETLVSALSGEISSQPSAIRLFGQEIGHFDPNKRREIGLLTAPEDRLGHAAAPGMSLVENAALTGWQRRDMVKAGLMNWGAATKFADEIIESFDVRTTGSGQVARALSGGNLQKFVIGREILQNPAVLVINQPTWGVDAAAAAAIRQALLDLAAKGTALLVVSQDIDELLELSDRFAALNAGELSAARPASALSMEEVGLMLGGADTPGHGG